MWLLECVLQQADVRMLDAPEIQLHDRSRRGQVSEYTWQAMFMVTAQGVLLHADLSPACLLLPEVRYVAR